MPRTDNTGVRLLGIGLGALGLAGLLAGSLLPNSQWLSALRLTQAAIAREEAKLRAAGAAAADLRLRREMVAEGRARARAGGDESAASPADAVLSRLDSEIAGAEADLRERRAALDARAAPAESVRRRLRRAKWLVALCLGASGLMPLGIVLAAVPVSWWTRRVRRKVERLLVRAVAVALVTAGLMGGCGSASLLAPHSLDLWKDAARAEGLRPTLAPFLFSLSARLLLLLICVPLGTMLFIASFVPWERDDVG